MLVINQNTSKFMLLFIYSLVWIKLNVAYKLTEPTAAICLLKKCVVNFHFIMCIYLNLY